MFWRYFGNFFDDAITTDITDQIEEPEHSTQDTSDTEDTIPTVLSSVQECILRKSLVEFLFDRFMYCKTEEGECISLSDTQIKQSQLDFINHFDWHKTSTSFVGHYSALIVNPDVSMITLHIPFNMPKFSVALSHDNEFIRFEQDTSEEMIHSLPTIELSPSWIHTMKNYVLFTPLELEKIKNAHIERNQYIFDLDYEPFTISQKLEEILWCKYNNDLGPDKAFEFTFVNGADICDEYRNAFSVTRTLDIYMPTFDYFGNGNDEEHFIIIHNSTRNDQ